LVLGIAIAVFVNVFWLKKKIHPVIYVFLNWKKASTAMEANAIVEGFIQSSNMHGLKYNKLIGN